VQLTHCEEAWHFMEDLSRGLPVITGTPTSKSISETSFRSESSKMLE